MENFEYYNPVRILFGKGTIASIDANVPSHAKILLAYGGGSIMKNGVYEQVIKALGDRNFIEFGGILPNPEFEYLMPAVDLVKKEQVDYILAVGGGSVVDACKFIAAASCYSGEDPWEILAIGAKFDQALPIGVVLTLPATGTEMNGNAVITRAADKHKTAFSSPLVYPQFSILDPEVSYSLPIRQVANGVIDAFVHVMEQYLTYPSQAEVQDHYAESLLRILKHEGGKAVTMKSPDYDNRANIMWAATNALNHFLSTGVVVDWTTHFLGHELTALHGLDHAVTLAIVLPGVMQVMKETRKERLLQYAERIWGLTGFDYGAIIDESIRNTEQLFVCLGVPVRLSDYDIGMDTIDLIEERLAQRNVKYLGWANDLSLEHVRPILESRL